MVDEADEIAEAGLANEIGEDAGERGVDVIGGADLDEIDFTAQLINDALIIFMAPGFGGVEGFVAGDDDPVGDVERGAWGVERWWFGKFGVAEVDVAARVGDGDGDAEGRVEAFGVGFGEVDVAVDEVAEVRAVVGREALRARIVRGDLGDVRVVEPEIGMRAGNVHENAIAGGALQLADDGGEDDGVAGAGGGLRTMRRGAAECWSVGVLECWAGVPPIGGRVAAEGSRGNSEA